MTDMDMDSRIPRLPSATVAEIHAAILDIRPAKAHVPLGLIISPNAGDDPLTHRYMLDMRRGDVFPAVRVHAGTYPFRLRDGSHRITASRILRCRDIVAELEYPPAPPPFDVHIEWVPRYNHIAAVTHRRPEIEVCAACADPSPIWYRTVPPGRVVAICDRCWASHERNV